MSQQLTIKVEVSDSLPHAADRFLEAVGQWARRVAREHADGICPDSHDAGTLMQPWCVYVRARGDAGPVEFMRRYRDAAKEHFEKTEQWHHGYWRRQEVHHGTEHFDIFLRALWNVAPGDAETARELEDAAEHIGNWVPEVPEWFDYERGVFRSYYLGTEVVGEPSVANGPDHVRMLNLCLLAHEVTGRERYLELARRYGCLWAEAILGAPELPAAVDEKSGMEDLGADQETYSSFAGEAPDDLSGELARAENLLASAVPEAMLDLWEKCGEKRFRAAAQRLCDVVLPAIENPIAWQAQAALRRFRDATGSTRYDRAVRELPRSCFRPVSQLTLVPQVEEPCITGPLGMRSDKPDWLDQAHEPCPSPLLWALRAGIDLDRELMTRAVDLALAHFQLARRAFGDLTSHGCGSTSLCAVARGHGRLNGAGMVTEVLAPALEMTGKDTDT